MSAEPPVDEEFTDEGVLYEEQVIPQHGYLGFTLRELLIVIAWFVMFATSFFPVGWGPVLWAQGISWILPLALPTVAVFLIVLRRFSPEGIRRVGSLGIDQFASVAFSVAAVWWIQLIWEFISALVQSNTSLVVWVPWVQLTALLALVVFTVFAPIVPGLRDDFRGRLVTLAHRNANPARPVIAAPRPAPVVRSAGAVTDAAEAADASTPVVEDDDGQDDAVDLTEELGFASSVPLTEHASGGELGLVPETDEDYVPGYARSSNDDSEEQPFWALAPTVRDVVDEQGEFLYEIGPDAWTLVIEDRDGAYVVRHDDGRVGYLHDVADMTRG